MKTIKPTQAVATILRRYQRRRNCQVPVTATDVYADTLARVCGNDVCQSAPNIDPQSAPKIDPFWHDGSWPDAV